MGQKVDLRLAALLDEAETRTSCLVPANDADRKALDRRKPAEVICPRPGLYARRAKWELLKRHPDIRALMVVRGLATQYPDWVFAHVSAALAHGLQVSGRSLGKIHLATNQIAHTESSGQIVRHCVPNEELAECVSVGGVRVTSLLRTAFDCMRSLPADEALVVADSLLRKTGRTAWWLVRTIKDAYCGWRGIGRALAVARFADGRSENGGESMARAAIIRQGLEVPVLQQWFFDPVEGLGRRVDFAWYNEAGELVAIGELDGACKLEDADKVGKGGAALCGEKKGVSPDLLQGACRALYVCGGNERRLSEASAYDCRGSHEGAWSGVGTREAHGNRGAPGYGLRPSGIGCGVLRSQASKLRC